MIPTSFEYKKAGSVADAIGMLGDDGQILGGGQSLIPALKLRLNSVGSLIDISKIEAIQAISNNEKSITIGGGATHASIANNGELDAAAPMMGQAARAIGDIQVRNRGTIGGSMAHADPAADWPAVLLASDAIVMIQGKDGKRTVDIDQFFTGFYETALSEGEVITGVSIPKSGFNKNSAYAKFKQPASRFAIVGCAVAVDIDGGVVKEARVAITGVSDSAYRATSVEKALVGQALTAESIAAVGDVTEGRDVMSDHYASEKYRTHLASVYVKRALKKLL